MYVVIAGGGKVGVNLARELLSKGFEVTLIEQRRDRYTVLEDELEHAVQYGDATEMWVLERAGILRADLVVAVTGDDEDNIVICQMAREKYMCERIVARVNNPNNLEHFDLLGIRPAVSATNMILRLIEHEVPNFGFVHLLELNDDKLEIIEVEIAAGSGADGVRVGDVSLPEGSLIISVLREEGGLVPTADTVLNAGEEVLVVLSPGLEAEVAAFFTGSASSAGLN
jgi:trk system potassium uptake protein TrkA